MRTIWWAFAAILIAASQFSIVLAEEDEVDDAATELTDQIVLKIGKGVDPRTGIDLEGLGLDYVSPVGILGSEGYHIYTTKAGLKTSRSFRKRASSANGVEWAMEQRAKELHKRASQDDDTANASQPKWKVPQDPAYSSQWHLSVINAPAVWATGNMGQGSTICIVDDGLEFTHPDMAPNYQEEATWDFNRNQRQPTPTNYDDHGTSSAGVAAARDNSVCGVGVAYRAGISAVRLISATVTDAVEAQGLSYRTDLNDIISCSWGPTDDGRRKEGPGPLAQLAMKLAVQQGRKGLGTIYIWAGGNGRRQKDNCNYDGYANSRLTITVGSVGQNMVQAPYSESCAALMTVAPSSATGFPSITTTDLMGTRGTSKTDCTSTFGGTSAAAPMAAGVAALILNANPNLTYRDMQHIFVLTAQPVSIRDSDWAVNGAGLRHSHKYGFGLMNVSGAVALAKKWKTVAPEVSYSTGNIYVNQAIPEGRDRSAQSTVLVQEEIVIEWVEVVFSANIAKSRGDLTVQLISPSGVTAILAEEHDDNNADYKRWTFTSCRTWGESSRGKWTLRVIDTRANKIAGEFVSWTLNIYGTPAELKPLRKVEPKN